MLHHQSKACERQRKHLCYAGDWRRGQACGSVGEGKRGAGEGDGELRHVQAEERWREVFLEGSRGRVSGHMGLGFLAQNGVWFSLIFILKNN